MPELPEVETTLRGIRPHLEGRRIRRLMVRDSRLRLPIPSDMPTRVAGQSIRDLSRRSKYILIHLDQGTLLVHLGMSGSLRIVTADAAFKRHDHLDILFDDGRSLRFHDPRRFGIFLWAPESADRLLVEHPLLRDLGPEPLSDAFSGDHLHRLGRARRVAIKSFVMDATVVVGVGNIYASESLFLAGIHPSRACNRVSLERCERLAAMIRFVLQASIDQGGTTLRDFVNEDGEPGYFAQSLRVYGRAGEPCRVCGEPIRQLRIGQRSSFYCAKCQR